MKPVSEKIGNRRLLKLAALLRSLPRKRFDYSKWVGEDWKGAQNLSCGTTACALGWATTIPSLRRVGLRMQQDSMGGYVVLDGINSSDSWEAGAKVFSLSMEESEYLFTLDSDEDKSTPKQAARKIENFVKRRSA